MLVEKTQQVALFDKMSRIDLLNISKKCTANITGLIMDWLDLQRK